MRQTWFWMFWACLPCVLWCAGCQPAAQPTQSDRSSTPTDTTVAEPADAVVEQVELEADDVDVADEKVASADSEASRVVPVDAESEVPGLPVGSKAPDFALQNQAGESVRLSDLLQENNVAIVFYRSADW